MHYLSPCMHVASHNRECTPTRIHIFIYTHMHKLQAKPAGFAILYCFQCIRYKMECMEMRGRERDKREIEIRKRKREIGREGNKKEDKV